jgi:hypothetical protein
MYQRRVCDQPTYAELEGENLQLWSLLESIQDHVFAQLGGLTAPCGHPCGIHSGSYRALDALLEEQRPRTAVEEPVGYGHLRLLTR